MREVIEKALKYQPEERASISALKYQADLYHVNLRQKNTNVASETRSVHSVVKPTNIKVKFNAEPQSLKRVDS